MRIIVLATTRKTQPDDEEDFFRFTRHQDLLPLLFSYTQFACFFTLTLHMFWLSFRADYGSPAARDIRLPASYGEREDTIVSSFLVASVVLISAGVLSRLIAMVYFLRKPTFAHRGIYRYSLFSSFLAIVSLVDGSLMAAVAKSLRSYTVFKVVTSLSSLFVYDLVSTILVVSYYFSPLNPLDGVTFGPELYMVQDLLAGTTAFSIVALVFRIFMITLMRASLASTPAEDAEGYEDPMDDAAVLAPWPGGRSAEERPDGEWDRPDGRHYGEHGRRGRGRRYGEDDYDDGGRTPRGELV